MTIDEKMEQVYYKKQSQEIFNVLYDKRMLADNLSAETLERVKTFISDMMVLQIESSIKVHDLCKQLRDPIAEKSE